MRDLHATRAFAWLLALATVACAGPSEGEPLPDAVLENSEIAKNEAAPEAAPAEAAPEAAPAEAAPEAAPAEAAPEAAPEAAQEAKEDNVLSAASGEGHAVVKEGSAVPEITRAEPPEDLAEDDRVLILDGTTEKYISRAQALHDGYTVVNFRDDWTPYLFAQHYDSAGRPLENRYRPIYIGLANDLTDGDGRPLEDNEDNYLEVFGIPPSLSVIQKRFLGDKAKTCYDDIDFDLIGRVSSMTYKDKARNKKLSDAKAVKAELAAAAKKAGFSENSEGFAKLAEADPSYKAKVAEYEDLSGEFRALTEVEKRLLCDGHTAKRFGHKDGQLDHGLRLSVRRFQRKHMIYEHTNLRGVTMKTLALKPIVTNYQAFSRAVTERVVEATSILEDGSASRKGELDTFMGADGKTYQVRNLVDEFTEATLKGIGADSPEAAQAFFERRKPEEFKWLTVGVKMPEYPEYYSKNMQLSVYVDQGDIWFDPPWNDKGKKIAQPRPHMPSLTVYTEYMGKKIRLVRLPTTIGGWRDELSSNGYEYYRYKGSEAGSRVIRKVIAGPVWVAPQTTPLRSLAKRRYINGTSQGIVNYDEMGPGYLSSYGLVAGYFVIPGKDAKSDVDHGIRAHGSSDFMSIFSPERYSHGCHRLVNHKAVRMYGFMLNHRNKVIDGDQKMNHQRQFLYKDAVYEIRMPSRGFQYTLDPPIPVTVNSGNIKGHAQKPIEGLVKIPGSEYPEDLPE